MVRYSISSDCSRLLCMCQRVDYVPIKNIVSALVPGPHNSHERSSMHKKILKSDLAHHEEKIPRGSFHADFYFSLYMLVIERNDIKDLFDKLASPSNITKSLGMSVLTRKQFQYFLTDRQHDCRLNEQLHPPPNDYKISALMTRFSTAKSKGLRFKEFARFLLSDESVDLDHRRFVIDEDTLHDPLPHYFINSSHNTYATGAQINTVKYFMSVQHDVTTCDVEIYRQILLSGCRCIELDCWDGPNDVPIITHGPIEVTKMNTVPLMDVCQAIADSAFKTSDLPVVLSIENHCCLQQQRVIASTFEKIFGDTLLKEPLPDYPLEPNVQLPSPWKLRRKILIKAKRQSASKVNQRLAFQQLGSLVSQDSIDYSEYNQDTQRALAHYLKNKKEQRAWLGEDDDALHMCDEAPEERRISKFVPCADPTSPVTSPLTQKPLSSPALSFDGSLDMSQRKMSEVTSRQIKSQVKPEKEVEKIAKELSDLVNYIQAERSSQMKIDGSDKPKNFYIMHSLSEEGMSKLVRNESRLSALVKHTTRQIVRVYPSGIRVSSSNFLPLFCWMAGAQMAALNFQTNGLPMQFNQTLFMENGACGYVRKPQPLRDISLDYNPQDVNVPATIPETLTVTVISGQFLSLFAPSPSTLITVDLYDLPRDTVRNKYKTRIVHKNGLNPVYEQDQAFVFERILKPEGAFLVLRVFNGEGGELAHRILPVHKMNRGYRHVVLHSSTGHPIGPASLFCHFALDFYVPPQHRDIQLSLMDPVLAMQRREEMNNQFLDPVGYRMHSSSTSSMRQREEELPPPKKASASEVAKEKIVSFLFGGKM
ncbi:hypothetical protein PRIPAC_72760 [Pristionchus pacificus]|nr:hypothetical protein PRIPAC_72760 [Pristionchus pacificus]